MDSLIGILVNNDLTSKLTSNSVSWKITSSIDSTQSAVFLNDLPGFHTSGLRIIETRFTKLYVAMPHVAIAGQRLPWFM